ncbi:chemotaxis protein CheB [Frateuria hangzhouensis]|uniref:chemotaxis protein CheB n=1 Tax=Frateuria hangzhouensis TaxID=2995589 RepID=UPI002260C3D5|nr:chemotaxis protein CheB [Frateuria sp. STR12]MCX7513774.1 chemotaxis protein CheB [Frateuria sp. STR12]
MAEAVPAVALLFDDAGLGEQLRSALQERGARIVHEGPLKGLSRELVSSVDADVLVVNLDDEDDEALDRLDESLDGDRPRVVFNDGQASRRLEGWDRARWARHLAMKVLAMGDADPPRPPVPAETAVEPGPAAVAIAADESVAAIAELPPEVDEEARQAAVSETLAAELEALLASDAPVDENEFGSGLNYAAGEGIALHDGNFGQDMLPGPDADDAMPAAVHAAPVEQALSAEIAPSLDAQASEPAALELTAITEADAPMALDVMAGAAAAEAEPPARASFQLDHLGLAPIGEDAAPAPVPAAAEPVVASRLSDSWTLLDDDAPAAASAAPAAERGAPADFGIEKVSATDYLAPEGDAAPVEHASPADFGIEKVSAADYLAPDADDGESPVLPGLSLELVSMEEAIAPQEFAPVHEMVLEAPDSVLPKLVVLGATTESTASVGEFLAALPTGLQATVLHTQHLAGRPADGLVDYFASQCALPVRLAEAGLRARTGEVIVVPSDRQVSVRRDGAIELQPVEAGAAHVPSIDASFTQAANAFGHDVVAIVFAGRSTDALAGCQAVRDRGGQVWVEASGGAHAADMVSGVLDENLSHHAGTPRELAARLAEQFLEGQP